MADFNRRSVNMYNRITGLKVEVGNKYKVSINKRSVDTSIMYKKQTPELITLTNRVRGTYRKLRTEFFPPRYLLYL